MTTPPPSVVGERSISFSFLVSVLFSLSVTTPRSSVVKVYFSDDIVRGIWKGGVFSLSVSVPSSFLLTTPRSSVVERRLLYSAKLTRDLIGRSAVSNNNSGASSSSINPSHNSMTSPGSGVSTEWVIIASGGVLICILTFSLVSLSTGVAVNALNKTFSLEMSWLEVLSSANDTIFLFLERGSSSAESISPPLNMLAKCLLLRNFRTNIPWRTLGWSG